MANQQNKTPKKTILHPRFSNKKILFALLGALVLTAGLWYGWSAYQSHQRFAYADLKKLEVANIMKTKLGDNVGETRIRNECFNTEQGPYDNGRLWCQTAIVVDLRQDTDFKTLGSLFMEAGMEAGLKAYSNMYMTPRYTVEGTKTRGCSLSYNGLKEGYLGSSTRKVLNENDKPSFAISCSDRAAAKHYPFVD